MIQKRIKKDIVDNVQGGITMAIILNDTIPHVEQLDISTGYFDVKGYGLLRECLEKSVENKAFSMRLLLGKEAIIPKKDSFEKYAEQYIQDKEYVMSVKTSLDEDDLSRESRTDTTSLISLLKRSNVQVKLGESRFNHSKCYILGEESAFIGSSNFTSKGLEGNYELNAGLYQPGLAEQTRQWFDQRWDAAKDTKDELVGVLTQSKFGAPAKPHDVYMKMLFEEYKPLLDSMETQDGQEGEPQQQLTKFQQHAVRTGIFMANEFHGTIIADSTGLGKTNIGIEIIRKKILKEGKKVLLIAPSQVLHSMWEEKLKDVDINVREKLTTESLGRDTILDNLHKYRNIDLVLIDESQGFRSSNANRRKNLMKLMSVGKDKQVVLMSATPINNSIMDLYYQISIITKGNDAHFARKVGISNLYRHMRSAANKEGLQQGLEKIQQLLDCIMVRRTRSYIKDVYKDDSINGIEIKFPKHEYSPIRYSLSDLFGNIFERMLNDIGLLTMAPYGLEQYNLTLSEEEKKKHQVRAQLQTIFLLKRFESSIEAVKTSIKNRIAMYKSIRKVLGRGMIMRVRDFNNIMSKWSPAETDDDNNDYDTDEDERQKFFLQELDNIKTEPVGNDYDLARLKKDVDADLEILQGLLHEIEKITVDTKLHAVVQTILKDKALEDGGKKVLIFTEYMITAKYITKKLKEIFKDKTVECISGSTNQNTRRQYIKRFAPVANISDGEELEELRANGIDILISTEVLSEGQNLQDCNYVINYDLPWNPMRIVQRTGRIDRLTSTHKVIHSRACYPDDELDKILGLFGRLIDKIGTVNDTIGLDAELLGEAPTPKQFNGTIARRIRVLADGTDTGDTMDDVERESDIMPTHSPINELSKYVKEKGMDTMEEFPMGRRSGKKGSDQKVILTYLQKKSGHHVYFVTYNFAKNEILVPDDDSVMINEVACGVDEPVYLPMDGSNNSESFQYLLLIDKKARDAIIEKNRKVLEEVMNPHRKDSHEKIVSKIHDIITKEVLHGNIAMDDGELITDLIKSHYLRAWEDDLRWYVAEYERNKNINALITEIKIIRKRIGLDDKPTKESITTDDNITNTDLVLVGAMFITGEKFDQSKVPLDMALHVQK